MKTPNNGVFAFFKDTFYGIFFIEFWLLLPKIFPKGFKLSWGTLRPKNATYNLKVIRTMKDVHIRYYGNFF